MASGKVKWFDNKRGFGFIAQESGQYVCVRLCAHRCEYCAFYSDPTGGVPSQRSVDALVREFEVVATNLKPQTVFFGGGTPSLLNRSQWEKIVSTMECLDLLGAAEWTI